MKLFCKILSSRVDESRFLQYFKHQEQKISGLSRKPTDIWWIIIIFWAEHVNVRECACEWECVCMGACVCAFEWKRERRVRTLEYKEQWPHFIFSDQITRRDWRQEKSSNYFVIRSSTSNSSLTSSSGSSGESFIHSRSQMQTDWRAISFSTSILNSAMTKEWTKSMCLGNTQVKMRNEIN